MDRETIEVDVLFVGGGVASLSGALHLANRIEKHRDQFNDEITIAVLEKSASIGLHCLSGAVLNPAALKELVPDFIARKAPLEHEVNREELFMLRGHKKIKAPATPPAMNNHGNYIVSSSKLTSWLGELAEEKEVELFTGYAGVEIIYEGDRVVGVRTGDMGLDKNGDKKPDYEPGIDIQAKVTVFGEGPRGSLTKSLVQKFALDGGQNPQNYVLGVKEVWEVPESGLKPGYVAHTMGYPLDNDTYGGGFVYGMNDNLVSIGLIVGLDYADPYLDPYIEFQKYKTHPFIKGLLKGGKIAQYGAKSAPVGGYYSVPQLAVDGGVIIGDSAGLFLSQQMKGIHAAMKSGILAAEAILDALKGNDFSSRQLMNYQTALFESDIGRQLHKSRNFHQIFQHGRRKAMLKAAVQTVTGGRIPKKRLLSKPDFSHLRMLTPMDTQKIGKRSKPADFLDESITFEKETDVYYSGTIHEEQQLCHIRIVDPAICHTRCTQEYQNPCLRFCPANVYEMEGENGSGNQTMKLNFTNCLHCKTCDVKDPYENIAWTPPEGGGGPKYTVM